MAPVDHAGIFLPIMVLAMKYYIGMLGKAWNYVS
jgi:hypothetical protein